VGSERTNPVWTLNRPLRAPTARWSARGSADPSGLRWAPSKAADARTQETSTKERGQGGDGCRPEGALCVCRLHLGDGMDTCNSTQCAATSVSRNAKLANRSSSLHCLCILSTSVLTADRDLYSERAREWQIPGAEPDAGPDVADRQPPGLRCRIPVTQVTPCQGKLHSARCPSGKCHLLEPA
jgi:hypothetical protein